MTASELEFHIWMGAYEVFSTVLTPLTKGYTWEGKAEICSRLLTEIQIYRVWEEERMEETRIHMQSRLTLQFGSEDAVVTTDE